MPGTVRGRLPFWSADSRSIAFHVDGKFKRVDIDTGSVSELANAATPAGGAWNADDVILLAMGANEPIRRVSATGGEPAAVTRMEAGQRGHRSPTFLPEGHHFLYHVGGTPDVRGIYVGDLDGSASRRLLDAVPPVVYASGHLFYVRQRTLVAHPFDPARRALTGDPVAVAEVANNFSWPPDVTIVYRAARREAGTAVRRGSIGQGKSWKSYPVQSQPGAANCRRMAGGLRSIERSTET